MISPHRDRETRLLGYSVATSKTLNLIKEFLKGFATTIGIVIAALPVLTVLIERLALSSDTAFLFWGQAFSLLPGLPGKYVRKCFYFLTLSRCTLNCEIGFLTHIHDRRTQIGERVYVGSAVGIGWAILGDGCLVASRVSVLSGRSQHQVGPDGRLTPFDGSAAKQTSIGQHSWIGEGAIIMADVGSQCIVGAGSIVTKPVSNKSMVAGNPARLIRILIDGQDLISEPEHTGPNHLLA
jgi:virginiamycin A acetyltransferase